MVNFDFIISEDLRSSLDSDYAELKIAVDGKAHKAVHVLAGSIIEAVLVDYLITIDYKQKSGKDPLNMTFEKLIEACKNEQIISQRVSDLSSVIRSYRNLIHPARVVRLNERVDHNGAKIAEALVEMIVDEIAIQRKKTYGYTAQQIIDKMIRDSSTEPILGNILKQTNKLELEKLLTIIPVKYFELISDPEQPEDIGYYLRSFDICFRMTLGLVSDEIKNQIASKYAKMIRESSESEIQYYGEHFFVLDDLEYLSEDDRELVKTYVLHRLSFILHRNTSMLKGIGRFLSVYDATEFTDDVIRVLVMNNTREKASTLMTSEYYKMNDDVQEMIQKRLTIWISHYKNRSDDNSVKIIVNLKDLLLDDDLPF